MDRTKFYELLKENGIHEFSSHIPAGISTFSKEIPKNLVEVPDYDSFPLQEVEPRPLLSPKDIEASIVQAQYENICEEIGRGSQKGKNFEVFEEGREYESPEEFIKFKTAMLQYYNEEATKAGMENPVEICSEPMCLNMAIPTFKHCANHLDSEEQELAKPFIGETIGINSEGNNFRKSSIE